MQAMKTSAKVFGEEHLSTLISMAILTSTYGSQERWKEAEKLSIQVMETRKKAFGEKHVYILASMTHLASACRRQSRLK